MMIHSFRSFRVLTGSLILLASAACSGSTKHVEAQQSELTPAETLIARLDSVASSGRYYFGHHDDTAYGHTWRYVEGGSDVRAVTGDYPGLMSWDLGLIERDSARNLDRVPFDFMAAQIIAQHARGGINAISWHPVNPVSGGNSWDVSTSPLAMADSMTSVRDTLVAWIDRAAAFVGSLRDADGRRVPVIFRPWHENSGSWFWWGAGHATPQQYISLYRLTRERFDSAGIDNVVWAYSPDKDLTPEQYFSTYPGDEYVDILGTDIYMFGGQDGVEQYRSRIASQMPYVVEEARRRGKIAAFTETGSEGLPVDDWFTGVLAPAIDSLGVAYVCVWRNACETENPHHFYVPYPGHGSEADFKAFHDSGRPVFVK